MRTNVVSLKSSPPISCFSSSQVPVASQSANDAGIATPFYREQTEAISGPVDVLASVKECRRITGLSGRESFWESVPRPDIMRRFGAIFAPVMRIPGRFRKCLFTTFAAIWRLERAASQPIN